MFAARVRQPKAKDPEKRCPRSTAAASGSRRLLWSKSDASTHPLSADQRSQPATNVGKWDFSKIPVSARAPVSAVRELKVRATTDEPAPEPTTPTDEKSTDEKSEPASVCPTQMVTVSGAQCGAQYGGLGKYCFSGAQNWWFKERVKSAHGPKCSPGKISQTSDPIQVADGCLTDQIFNLNGPPQNVAPCTDTTYQTVFAGPTKAEVGKCKYSNTQIIEVTRNEGDAADQPQAGKVTMISGPAGAGVSTYCDWTA